MAFKGKFRPSNPQKYIGDPTNIMYRSSWEFKVMTHLDKTSKIKRWSSEEIIVGYYSPVDGKKHRYFPDFYVEEAGDKPGTVKKYLIEVKPFKQTKPPDLSKKLTAKGTLSRSYLNEVKTWGINQAKWLAAEEYCKAKGWGFQIMTEHEIFGKK